VWDGPPKKGDRCRDDDKDDSPVKADNDDNIFDKKKYLHKTSTNKNRSVTKTKPTTAKPPFEIVRTVPNRRQTLVSSKVSTNKSCDENIINVDDDDSNEECLVNLPRREEGTNRDTLKDQSFTERPTVKVTASPKKQPPKKKRIVTHHAIDDDDDDDLFTRLCPKEGVPTNKKLSFSVQKNAVGLQNNPILINDGVTGHNGTVNSSSLLSSVSHVDSRKISALIRKPPPSSATSTKPSPTSTTTTVSKELTTFTTNTPTVTNINNATVTPNVDTRCRWNLLWHNFSEPPRV
jgi:hypothetical protein